MASFSVGILRMFPHAFTDQVPQQLVSEMAFSLIHVAM